jgi:hypothetical protein
MHRQLCIPWQKPAETTLPAKKMAPDQDGAKLDGRWFRSAWLKVGEAASPVSISCFRLIAFI